MKTFAGVVIATAAVVLAMSSMSQTNLPPASATSEYPITGMTATELTRFAAEIKGQLPPSTKIISLSIKNESKVVVRTGHLNGPLGGGGERITFEFKNEKQQWIITERQKWLA